ncbi:LysR family transcriptional regulator [Vibrio sp. RE86]|uniref:LysR family transcriptional regulator n=1 Tax=Vibrio sp. RE86 TaxID=2607605 RepID=UPI001493702F|nr:LysR family transcriptional regulator [Vibrio sp. RE86]NOH79861.1 LysR family transcriptional regulator [Vibrio sp. RE86]
MNANCIEWSDIPFVLSVCESGSLTKAARQMNVNHSTVFRRIEAVEQRLGVKLFDRLTTGYVMTNDGEIFYKLALKLRNNFNEIQIELSGKNSRLEGALTVATTDSLLNRYMPVFIDFQRSFPDIELHLKSDPIPANITQGEADIVLRPTNSPPEHLIGRSIGEISCAVYAHKTYWESVKTRPKKSRLWVTLDDDLKHSPMAKITLKVKPEDAPTRVVNTVMGVVNYVKCGHGLAVLPTYLGDSYSELEKIYEPENNHNWGIWLLAHPNLHKNARIHAFFDFVSQRVKNRNESASDNTKLS